MTLAAKTLVALAVGSALALAQSNRDTSEARFKAKFGRNTPAVEARQAAEKASTAYRDATPPAAATAPAPNWAEQRHRAKFGRSTPAEEKRVEAEKGNTAYREVTTPPVDRWRDNYFESKFGRPAPDKTK